jgi:hypothetical protein
MKDLWSLINFLKVNPFTDKQWWRRTIERPLEKGDESALKYEFIFNILTRVMAPFGIQKILLYSGSFTIKHCE